MTTPTLAEAMGRLREAMDYPSVATVRRLNVLRGAAGAALAAYDSRPKLEPERKVVSIHTIHDSTAMLQWEICDDGSVWMRQFRLSDGHISDWEPDKLPPGCTPAEEADR